MNVRDDLWTHAGKAPSPALEQLENVVRRFLASPNWMTLLVKGPWGCGKTACVRSVLKFLAANDDPPFRSYSFITLSGRPDLTDPRRLLTRGEIYSRENVEGTLKKATHWVKSKASPWVKSKVDSVPHWSAKVAGTLADIVADRYLSEVLPGSLIVLDDLERRDKSIDLREVFGCVTLLAETHQCRVIVICNEDEITRLGDKKLFAQQREKVFDLEYRFEPPLVETIGAVVAGCAHGMLIQEVLSALNKPNLRVAAKLAAALDSLEQSLQEHNASDRVRLIAAKSLVVLGAARWAGGILVTPDMLSWVFDPMAPRMTKEFGPLPPALHTAIQAANAHGSAFDRLSQQWLEKGFWNPPELATAVKESELSVEAAAVLADVNALAEATTSSFGAVSDELVTKVQGHLRDRIQFFPARELSWALFLLELSPEGFDRAECEQRWAHESPEPEHVDFGFEKPPLQNATALEIYHQRLAKRLPDLEAPPDLVEALRGWRHSVLFVTHPEFQTVEWVLEQLRCASDSNLVQRIHQFLLRLAQPDAIVDFPPTADRQALRRAHAAFTEALTRLAKEQPVAANRIKFILVPWPDVSAVSKAAPPEGMGA